MTTERTAKRIQLPTLEKKVVEVYTDDEIGRLFGACEREITPELRHRDVAFLSLLLDCGLRAGEIVGLTLDCVHVVSNGGSWVEVTGKGMKSREVGLGVKASQRLFEYIRVYRKADRNERHVFVGYTGNPLNTNSAAQLMERLLGWAGVEHGSLHTCRHTMAVNYLRAGGNVFDLQRLLGHTNTTTTQLYLTAYSSQMAREKGVSVLDRFSGRVQ